MNLVTDLIKDGPEGYSVPGKSKCTILQLSFFAIVKRSGSLSGGAQYDPARSSEWGGSLSAPHSTRCCFCSNTVSAGIEALKCFIFSFLLFFSKKLNPS